MIDGAANSPQGFSEQHTSKTVKTSLKEISRCSDELNVNPSSPHALLHLTGVLEKRIFI